MAENKTSAAVKALLTREQILAADDRRHELLSVPWWGGDIMIWEWSSSDQLYLGQLNSDPNFDRTTTHAVYCARSICDETGSQVFSVDDIVALGRKSRRALEFVFDAVLKLNGIETGDEKNADADPASDSTSDSPTDSR
jgi:hypothetical protein